jgi:hypothetical protein
MNPDPDPLVRGMDPRIRIHTKMSWIRNIADDDDLIGLLGTMTRKKGLSHMSFVKGEWGGFRDLSTALEYGCLQSELLDFLVSHHTPATSGLRKEHTFFLNSESCRQAKEFQFNLFTLSFIFLKLFLYLPLIR